MDLVALLELSIVQT